MPAYYDSQNNAHQLAERIGSGGEGTVYFCEDRSLVAKIYHQPIDADKAEKLVWMAANKDERLLKVAAWVVDVLTDQPDGTVVGFLMPSVKAKEIHELYSLKSRRVYFPEATWHFLVHTAANVARAFYNLHRAGHVMGDVNHGNCVVLADGTVKLIDCDSYSIKTGERRYACAVGVATHLAPELQGADLSLVTRETKHDNFGLAVIIFQLLFLGRHPFAGTYLGAEDKSIEDCIRELRFAYGDDASNRQVKQPPGTLSLRHVSAPIAEMFARAFLTEDRPAAKEWIEALEDLSNNLEQCALHPGHLYANHLQACPFCEIENQTGVMLFPFVTENPLNGEKPFNVFTVESLIASIGAAALETLPAKPAPIAALPAPSANVVEARRASRNNLIVSLSAQFVGIIVLMIVFGVGIAAFLGIVAMICWLVFTNTSVKYLRGELSENLEEQQQQWTKLESEWTNGATVPSLDENVRVVRQKVDDYQRFQQENIREARQLQDIGVRRELFQHLRAQTVADAQIEGIGRQEKQWLVGKEIKTAAEISENRIRGFHDFNGDLVPKLLEWRAQLENDFMRQPHPINLKQENENFLRETARRRRALEMEIEHALGALRSGAVNVRRRRRELSKQATELAGKLAQTASDAAHLGTNSALVIGLILITFITPYVGFIVNQINEPPKPPPPAVKSGKSDADTVSPRDLETPAASITDAEIAQLSAERREIYAINLYTQVAEDMMLRAADLGEAERKMRLAIRLRPNDAYLFTQLGNILYKQGRHTDSLRELNRAVKLDQQDTGAKTYIGMNYLATKRFADAAEIFNEVAEQIPTSFEAHYNLGLAQMNLKRYEAARDALERAVKIRAYDADVHYQLGVCYSKLGFTDRAWNEYDKLLELNEDEKANQMLIEAELADKVAPLDSAPPPPPAAPR